jgi:hypothetical protein
VLGGREYAWKESIRGGAEIENSISIDVRKFL